MKAILRYTDSLQDGKNVFYTLGVNNVEILKTKQGISIYPEVIIRVKDNNELNRVVSALNRNCQYEVRVVRIKSDNGVIELIKKLFIDRRKDG